ncbi:MAG TPA: glycosyltransferase family 2 protein [Acidimicrobiales bacterium]|nr:glycosyltransferase family 2 protein [Acidimicrobiales bacterium]
MNAQVINEARRELAARRPGLQLSPVAVLICAYEEEANLGAVLKDVPAEACGMETTTVVVVDGGQDRTAEIALESGAVSLVFPVNQGHGVALRAGYDLCVEAGARYVVTLDADGQNDPAEIPVLLQPLVDDEADFVLASRRLGIDETVDPVRKAGVVVFAWLMNRLTGSHLTDTSNGYRALRASMLSDVACRLEQPQYQTAELLILCLTRGWRVTERPTVWRERMSGHSKKGSNLRFGLRYAGVIVATWLRARS